VDVACANTVVGKLRRAAKASPNGARFMVRRLPLGPSALNSSG
jgi:hypothetical protein